MVTWHDGYLTEQIFLLILAVEATVIHYRWWQKLSADNHPGPFRFHLLGKAINGVAVAVLVAMLLGTRISDSDLKHAQMAVVLLIFIVGYAVILTSTWLVEIGISHLHAACLLCVRLGASLIISLAFMDVGF